MSGRHAVGSNKKAVARFPGANLPSSAAAACYALSSRSIPIYSGLASTPVTARTRARRRTVAQGRRGAEVWFDVVLPGRGVQARCYSWRCRLPPGSRRTGCKRQAGRAAAGTGSGLPGIWAPGAQAWRPSPGRDGQAHQAGRQLQVQRAHIACDNAHRLHAASPPSCPSSRIHPSARSVYFMATNSISTNVYIRSVGVLRIGEDTQPSILILTKFSRHW